MGEYRGSKLSPDVGGAWELTYVKYVCHGTVNERVKVLWISGLDYD